MGEPNCSNCLDKPLFGCVSCPSPPTVHNDLEFQGYLLDKDRTDQDLLDWIKYIEDILAERGVNT